MNTNVCLLFVPFSSGLLLVYVEVVVVTKTCCDCTCEVRTFVTKESESSDVEGSFPSVSFLTMPCSNDGEVSAFTVSQKSLPGWYGLSVAVKLESPPLLSLSECAVAASLPSFCLASCHSLSCNCSLNHWISVS